MIKYSWLFKRLFCTLLVCILLLTSPLNVNASTSSAVLAGGCFWCLEHDMEGLAGVLSVESGYSGGTLVSPTYKSHNGHQEAVKVTFDPSQITFDDLLKSYWRNIDPYDSNGQFCDRGDSYRPVIYFMNKDQESSTILSIKKAADELSIPLNRIGVVSKKFTSFWKAEDYHQDFADRNSIKYNFYRYSCQRDKRLDEVWGGNARKGSDWIYDEP